MDITVIYRRIKMRVLQKGSKGTKKIAGGELIIAAYLRLNANVYERFSVFLRVSRNPACAGWAF